MILLAMTMCSRSKETSEENEPATAIPLLTEPGAVVLYRSKLYHMDILDDCGASADGTYRTWAVTRSAVGEIEPNEPHMLAMRDGNWSIIDFLLDEESSIIRVYRQDDERVAFVDRVLTFKGQTSTQLKDYIEVEIRCP